MPGKDESFEEKLSELEKVVRTLEEGDLSLEDAVKEFEKGIHLSATCNKILGQASKTVQILLDKAGKLVEEPMLDISDEVEEDDS